jgi:hypothetical protein
MKTIRLTLISMLSLMAFGAVATASASAAPCKEAAGKNAICVELGAELVLTEVAPITVTQEKEVTHQFVIETSIPTTVTCNSATGTGSGKETTEDVIIEKVKITFTECVVSSDEVDCEVATGSIVTGELTSPLLLETEEEEAGKPELELDAHLTNAESLLATFTIKSKAGHTCLGATANGKVKGAVLCYFLLVGQNIEVDELEHLLQCVRGGLTYAGTAASLEAEFAIKLAEPNLGDKWSVQENTE